MTRVRGDRREGQDWAEKISAEVGTLLGLPTARIELALRAGQPGCISADLKPGPAWELQAGAVLIEERDPGFLPKTRGRIGHNLANIRRCLEGVRPPTIVDIPLSFGAYEVFCGYLIFDAWIANQDRHVENWSVLQGPSGSLGLAATYDHGSSLAFNLTDEARLHRLGEPRDLDVWLRRGSAGKFEDGRGVSLVDFAHQALGLAEPGTWAYWRDKLGGITNDRWGAIIASVPEMSDPARRFVDEMLDQNRRRLLDAGD